MPAEARVTPIWKKQKLFLSLFCFAFASWFLFDGVYAYPKENIRWQAHEKYVRDGALDQWPAYAKTQGWVVRPPEKLHAFADLAMQIIIAGIFGTFGLLMIIYWATQRKRTLRTDEDAVYTAAGTRVPFEAITGVNKLKWDSKGIAKVRYALEGRKGEFVVDDYKFDAEGTHQILAEIEVRMPGAQRRDSSEAAA